MIPFNLEGLKKAIDKDNTYRYYDSSNKLLAVGDNGYWFFNIFRNGIKYKYGAFIYVEEDEEFEFMKGESNNAFENVFTELDGFDFLCLWRECEI